MSGTEHDSTLVPATAAATSRITLSWLRSKLMLRMQRIAARVKELRGANLDIDLLDLKSQRYRRNLVHLKAQLAPTEFAWYPYAILNHFHQLNRLLSGANRDFPQRLGNGLIADIGAADGDTAFFLESLGHRVHAIDFPPTNFNHCRGIHLLKKALNSQVEILEVDLDAQFQLPSPEYALAFFLGILYHLKNPYYALESLAKSARHAFISTRITRFNRALGSEDAAAVTNRSRLDISHVPAAYLVAPDETNNDASNFWMFTEAGLRRILDRCGWDVLDFMTIGNTSQSDPATQTGDERAFCYVRSRHFAAE